MNAGAAPTCPTCGGLNTNPGLTRCRYCGAQLAVAHAHGAPPPGYGPMPPPGHGAMPHGHGPTPYGAPPPGYGPTPHGAPPAPYGQVHGFGGQAPFPYGPPPVHYQQPPSVWRNLVGGLSTFFWIRVCIAVVAVGISLVGACVSAIQH